MKHRKIGFVFTIDYERPDNQSNYDVIAKALQRHAEDIYKDPNRAGCDSLF